MLTRRSLLVSIAASSVVTLVTPIAAFAATHKIHTKNGLSIGGYDPVAYFTQNSAMKGKSAHALEWGGETWHFVSDANKAKFEADPKAYAPQFGGYCAYAASKGALADGDPEAWTVYKGKLYLNFNKNVRTIWTKDIDANIALAHKNWPRLSAQ